MQTKIQKRNDQTRLNQPIVIFGGFLSTAHTYQVTGEILQQISGQKVSIVPTEMSQWLLSITAGGWEALLNELERTVRLVVKDSHTGKITLVGHSSGGVLSRQFLSPEPFRGHSYRGLEWVNRLITLGSPHRRNRGSPLHHRLERHYPGAYYSSDVEYVSVAGKAVRGNSHGSLKERKAYLSYRTLCGNGDTWGDGLVPLSSAILEGSYPIILEGASHYSKKKFPWYGSPDVISQWWDVLCDREMSKEED